MKNKWEIKASLVNGLVFTGYPINYNEDRNNIVIVSRSTGEKLGKQIILDMNFVCSIEFNETKEMAQIYYKRGF